jgi:hypothetical protein
MRLGPPARKSPHGDATMRAAAEIEALGGLFGAE